MVKIVDILTAPRHPPWGPLEVFDDLQKTSFRSWKRKQGHEVKVEDGSLLGFVAFKDF